MNRSVCKPELRDGVWHFSVFDMAGCDVDEVIASLAAETVCCLFICFLITPRLKHGQSAAATVHTTAPSVGHVCVCV